MIMKCSSKVAVLRSLKRVLDGLRPQLEFRKKNAPPGSIEMGHLLGLEDGWMEVFREIQRLKKLKSER